MVLFDPERRWTPRAACRYPEDWNLFFAAGGTPDHKPSPGIQRKLNQAKEICAGCPALMECRRDTLGEEYGVYGGYDQYERFKIRRALFRAVQRWPDERRLAWGREIQRMRKAGMAWRTITTQTGIPAGTAEVLLKVAEEHAPKPAPAEVVVHLPEPGAPRAALPFPDRPGTRHAWVRHNGRVADAMYRGETPTGKWVLVTVQTGRGQAHKWIARKDVLMYHPQPVIIMSKRKEAPDAPAECEPAV